MTLYHRITLEEMQQLKREGKDSDIIEIVMDRTSNDLMRELKEVLGR